MPKTPRSVNGWVQFNFVESQSIQKSEVRSQNPIIIRCGIFLASSRRNRVHCHPIRRASDGDFGWKRGAGRHPGTEQINPGRVEQAA
jgi:hypothetical protein